VNAVLRTPVEADWPAILDAANASLPWAPEKNQEWLHNRKEFDRTGRGRRHYVAEDIALARVVGYGGIEELQKPDRYRIFVVMSPDHLMGGLGDQVFDRLTGDLRELQATAAVAQEEARDLAVTSFLKARGFRETERFTAADGTEIVRLESCLCQNRPV
jgi:L-amino acid N-acyltransferase YncA